MKKILMITLLAMAAPQGAMAQTQEVTQLVLNLEKLRQLRKTLQELKKGYDILFEGYTKIRDISRGNFELHQAFLDGLLKVSPAVKNYGRIRDIVQMQLAIVRECQQGRSRLSASGLYSPAELDYLTQVYHQLTSGSLQSLDALLDVVTDKKLRASDDQRLSAIDAIYEQVSEKLIFLRHLNSNNSVLAAQRKDEAASIKTSQMIYDVQP